MKQNQIIEATVLNCLPNELIFASQLFNEQLSELVSETAYYKTLERLCKSGKLSKLSKGTYYIPRMSSFGVVPISDREIVASFTKNGTGTVVGYSLYNRLGLTTQISKTITVLSSLLETQTKRINNIVVRYSPLQFSDDVTRMVQALDVLQNVYQIEDINYSVLLQYCSTIAKNYDQSVLEEVLSKQRYSKSTIAFLQEILNFYEKENGLNRYLSSLSNYKFPKMEELYAASRASSN